MNRASKSIANLVVFSLCLLLVAALFLPFIVRQRAAARSVLCSNNLKQVGLAIHNYHSAYKQLPQSFTGTNSEDGEDWQSNHRQLSFLVALTPFIEEQALWEQIANPFPAKNGKLFPPMGPIPTYDSNIYTPWSKGPSVFRCPDRPSPNRKAPPKIVYTLKSDLVGGPGLMANYVACFGDGTHMIGRPLPDPRFPTKDMNQLMLESRASHRGFFIPGRITKFRDILDGLSNTIMVSECQSDLAGKKGLSGVAVDIVGLSDNPSLCKPVLDRPQVEWWTRARGSLWCDGTQAVTGFQTVLPPNSPSCASDKGIEDAVISASSYHQGGVHVLMGDGAVVFITNSIEAGDSTRPGVHIDGEALSRPGDRSPYGLWGALGSRASKEVIEEQLRNSPPQRQRPSLGAALGALFSGQATQHEFSKWTDKSGEMTLSARFRRIIDKKTIELEDAAGILHQVPLNTLTDEDIFRAVQLELKIAPNNIRSNRRRGRSSSYDRRMMDEYERAMMSH